jgi:tetratricopeptide (TPR) repeat protein
MNLLLDAHTDANREAIHSFEAAVHLDETHSEAWRCLGQAHADNDDDQSAITCLHNAVHYDPFNLEARLSLGVSYLNEKNYTGALQNLRAWAQHNPEFVGMDQEVLHQPSSVGDSTISNDLMQVSVHVGWKKTSTANEMCLIFPSQLMDNALETAPGDPQALIVQGLLYTLRMEYQT